MAQSKHIVGFGLSAIGLLLGLICAARVIGTALDSQASPLQKRKILMTGLWVGIPTTVGALWMLKDLTHSSQGMLRQRQIANAKRLQLIFHKALNANNGKISAIQFAMLAEVALDEAKYYLEDWANVLDADLEVDAAGIVVYCFSLPLES
ncbi:MAG: hypothetical protein HC800_02610 [Phormidesmis sp. RL_2_1]|nr:hypothetical protein [Phormidesmis sp. RL_2_1]